LLRTSVVIARAEDSVRPLETKIASIQRAIEQAAESGIVPAILVTRLRDLEQEQRAAKLAALETRKLRSATGSTFGERSVTFCDGSMTFGRRC
jgi:hypothetical protein